MPEQRQRRGSEARAVVAASQGQQQGGTDGASRALVAVTHEIDNRLAIVGASAVAGIKPERLKLVALSAFTRTPSLWTCDPVSVARSIVEAAQLGLEPTGLLGGAYLVPRGQQCTLLVGYRGLVMLAMRSQLVQRVEARVVRAKDTFDYGYGLEPYLHHTPSKDPNPGDYTAAYAVIFYRDGSRQFDVMSYAEIEDVRKRSSSPNAGPWVSDWAEMAKKTPLRRLMKMAPLTLEVAAKLDELDPEVRHDAPAQPAQGTAEEARLRDELQQALAREYGGEQQPVTEGTYREEPATTQAGSGHPAEGAAAAAGGSQAAGQAAAPVTTQAGGDAGEGKPAAKPEEAPAAAGAPTQCGARSESLGAGPCVLPAQHQQAQYTVGATTYPPQREHEEAGGTRWTQPR